MRVSIYICENEKSVCVRVSMYICENESVCVRVLVCISIKIKNSVCSC